MSKKLLYDITKTKEIKNSIGNVKIKKYEVKKDGKVINIKSIKSIIDNIQKEADNAGKNIKILAQGVGVLGQIILKGTNETSDEMLERNEEYFEGQVRDNSKFESFSSVGISIYYL